MSSMTLSVTPPKKNGDSNTYKKEKSPVILAVLFVLFVAGIATAFIITQSKSLKSPNDYGTVIKDTIILDTSTHKTDENSRKTDSQKRLGATTELRTTTSIPTSKKNPATLTEQRDPSRELSTGNTNGRALEMPNTNPTEMGASFDERNGIPVKRSPIRNQMLRDVDSTSWSGLRDNAHRHK